MLQLKKSKEPNQIDLMQFSFFEVWFETFQIDWFGFWKNQSKLEVPSPNWSFKALRY